MIFRLLLLPLLLLSGCGVTSTANSTELDAEVPTTSDIAMSLPALDTMGLAEGTAIIVPLDQSILALDADALAAFASEESLEELLVAFVLDDQVTEADLVDGATLRTVDGRNFNVTIDDGVTHIGAGTLVELRLHDGVTLVVVDSLLES